jgi:hypothetical protein
MTQTGVQMAGGRDDEATLKTAVAFIQGDALYPDIKPYLRNAVFCNLCSTVAESGSRHEMRACHCGKVSVDGGHDYLKRAYTTGSDYTELSTINPKYKGPAPYDPAGRRFRGTDPVG